ncbi:DEAD/DEAH box helicase [Streptomyces anandii]|uniref:DEAD/DEAH box helicase n=1 Tax=Streptomyces anandii TaxID=285454 RepID=UPI0036C0E99C
MAEIEIPEDFDELKRWLEIKESQAAEIVEQIPVISQELAEERKAEQELVSKLAEIRRRRQAKQDQQDLLRKQARLDQAAMAQAKRRLETFMSEKAIQENLKTQWAEFDKITSTYKWREFAFNHQIEGAKRLASAKRGILGDKRGLGKSLTSLIWADMIGAKKILVFAPKDVLENFKREIEHWTPHRNVTILGGMNKVQRDMFLPLLSGFDQWLVLCNYEAWRRDAELVEYIKMLKADTVIIDEAHNIKEKKTSAYQGIRDIVYAENACNVCGGNPTRYRDPFAGIMKLRCETCLHEPAMVGDFCSVKHVLPMTGTAILNKPQDLWTLLNLVDRVLFPSERAFLQDYCAVDHYTGRWRFRPGGEEALIKRLGSKFIKRDKKDLPEGTFKKQIIERHYIDFDKGLYPDQWKVMEEIKNFGAIKMSEDTKLDVIGILPEILRRRQAITWPAGIKIWEYVEDVDGNLRKTGRALYEAPATESIKMDKLMEIAQEIIFEDEDRLVVFSQFKEALKEAERRFKKLDVTVVRYDGDISDEGAKEAQLDFDGKTAPNHPLGSDCNSECKYWGQPCSGYKYQVILAHYKKGGVGLNLNAARQMIILDREWNPGKEDQAQGRVDRIDNMQDSIVHTIHVNGTVDMFMDDLIEEKSNVIEGFESTHDMLERMVSALRDGDLM